MLTLRDLEEAIEYINNFLPEDQKITKITKKFIHFAPIVKKIKTLKIPTSCLYLNEATIEAIKYLDLNTISESLTSSINSAISANNKLLAIKVLRNLTGIPLKDAKDIIDYNF